MTAIWDFINSWELMTGLLAGSLWATLMLTWNPGSLRALRSWLQRRSEPRPYVSVDLQYTEYHDLHQKKGVVSRNCDLCNPPPTSPQPSAPPSKAEAGKAGG